MNQEMLTGLEDLIFCVCMKMWVSGFSDSGYFEMLQCICAICMKSSAGVKVCVDTVQLPFSA